MARFLSDFLGKETEMCPIGGFGLGYGRPSEPHKRIIVYKVVERDKRGYRSFAVSPRFGGTRYRIGQVARPKAKNSPLMAFKSLDDAKNFSGHNPILECEAELMTGLPNRLCDHGIWGAKKIHDFWKNAIEARQKKKRVPLGYPCPRGTVFCKSIRPLRVVRE